MTLIPAVDFPDYQNDGSFAAARAIDSQLLFIPAGDEVILGYNDQQTTYVMGVGFFQAQTALGVSMQAYPAGLASSQYVQQALSLSANDALFVPTQTFGGDLIVRLRNCDADVNAVQVYVYDLYKLDPQLVYPLRSQQAAVVAGLAAAATGDFGPYDICAMYDQIQYAISVTQAVDFTVEWFWQTFDGSDWVLASAIETLGSTLAAGALFGTVDIRGEAAIFHVKNNAAMTALDANLALHFARLS